MTRRIVCLALLALVAGAGTTRAAGDMLDLIPADATAAFTIRNLTDLKKKGDKFLKDSEMKVGLRPSEFFEHAYEYLGTKGCVDEDAAGGIILVNPKVNDGKLGLWDLEQLLVAAVPFSDRDKITAKYGFKKGELKDDKVTAVPRPKDFVNFALLRGKHLFLARNKAALESLAAAKPVGGEVAAERRKALNGADMLLHLGVNVWGRNWTDGLAGLEKDLASKDEGQRQTVERLIKTLESVRFVDVSLRLDDGMAFQFLATFAKDLPAEARQFLTALRAGPGAADLKGLPKGNVVTAYAARTNGAENALIARLFIHEFLRYELETSKLLSSADRPLFTGVFTEIWKRLTGRRLAVYQNADPSKHGLFSAVMILDTDDPKKLLDEVAALAKFAEGKDLDLSDKTGKAADVATVKKLIKELGDDNYEKRETATTKLALIGEPALPLLEKAMKSDDLEVARRAEDLVTAIKERAASLRKELLDKTAVPPIRPGFVLTPNAERLGEQRVEIVNVKLGAEDATAVKQMRQVLGPDWHKIRVAVVGKQVVVLVGSDLDLFKQALKNVKDGAAGLASDKSLALFNKLADAKRKTEAHVAIAAFDALTDPKGPQLDKVKGGTSLTSLALTVEKDRIEVNLVIPMEEVRQLVKSRGW